jgi:NAD(P)-dependent dehydrogenase (short-subunit alcohol dehydrogenase family)
MHNSLPFDAHALQDQVAVVTGAFGGLGVAICEQLRAMGAQVVQVDIRIPDGHPDTDSCTAVACDLADPAAITRMAALVRERHGRCDVLVNNAAMSSRAVKLEDLPLALWDQMFHVNLRGALLCAQVTTQVGAYGPTKAALRALTHQMAVEWGPRGVRANSVSPGMILTPLSQAFYQVPGKRGERESKIPARRIGAPADIGQVVGFLASSASAYVNGQDLVVDGGFLKASLANLYRAHRALKPPQKNPPRRGAEAGFWAGALAISPCANHR